MCQLQVPSVGKIMKLQKTSEEKKKMKMLVVKNSSQHDCLQFVPVMCLFKAITTEMSRVEKSNHTGEQ